ncbi:hypothetical protein F511_40228 [Dorcoceras hygrometricum]|uniref:Uncharacterized protein n=1 Tax=Dorcoceras hygrometricum TaxID=472368 RepID=A0A2Z7B7R2_9LAMI|nr:hypothetical protein F511_40228 [Dorcoceras hygrometricum]
MFGGKDDCVARDGNQVDETPSTKSSDGFEGAQVEEDQPEGTTRLDPDLVEIVAPNIEQRMEIVIKSSWAITDIEIGHLGAGEKKTRFITAYQFLEVATPGAYTDKVYPYIFSKDVALMDSSFYQLVTNLRLPSLNVERPM